MTVAHLTTVHPRGDVRIRVKEVASLAEGLGEQGRPVGVDAHSQLVKECCGLPPHAGLVDTPPPGQRLAAHEEAVWMLKSLLAEDKPVAMRQVA